MTSNNLGVYGGAAVRKDYLVFGSPKITEAEINEVVLTLRSGWIGSGPKVVQFQSSFKDYIGCRHAFAVNSCTAAMHLSLIAAGVKAGDEVITTPMTFAATGNVIVHLGATPVFADCDLSLMTILPEEIEKKITPKTKAIIVVSMAGRPCLMDEISAIAKRHRLILIEDAAHALGASYKGKRVGTLADFTAFSFYVTKNLVTSEGGMITTNDDRAAEILPMYALHGMSKDAWKRYSDEGFKHYLIEVPGYKYNMTDIQASLGIHQMRSFESMQERRHEIWNLYNDAFRDLPVTLPAADLPDTLHAHHLYTLLCDLDRLKVDRDSIQWALHKENIGTGIHFMALHLHPYYQRTFGLKRGDFPNAEFISDRTISLPLSAKLTKQDVEDVVRAVQKVFRYYLK